MLEFAFNILSTRARMDMVARWESLMKAMVNFTCR